MQETETIKITAVNRIERDGAIINPGDSFECETQEAERLVDLGAARLFVPEDQEEAGADEGSVGVSAEALAKAEFIAAIEAAATYEEVLALMPEEEPDPEIAAIFEKRLEELKEG